jgi:hypothetical protein
VDVSERLRVNKVSAWISSASNGAHDYSAREPQSGLIRWCFYDLLRESSCRKARLFREISLRRHALLYMDVLVLAINHGTLLLCTFEDLLLLHYVCLCLVRLKIDRRDRTDQQTQTLQAACLNPSSVVSQAAKVTWARCAVCLPPPLSGLILRSLLASLSSPDPPSSHLSSKIASFIVSTTL